MKYRFILLLSCSIFYMLTACKDNTAPRIVPVNTSLGIDINRYEQKLMQIDINAIDAGLVDLEEKTPRFTELYFNNILSVDAQTSRTEIVKDMLQDTGYHKLYAEIENVYPENDLGSVNSELAQALKNYIEFFNFPNEQLPTVTTFISGFVYQALVYDDGGKEGVAVALEMFLGDAFPYKEAIPDNPMFSNYLTRTYNQDHMAKKVIEVLVEDKIPPPAKSDFLSLIIWGGKKLYLIDQILDFKSDAIIAEYTEEQLEWCQQNQAQIWNFFFENDLFYKTDMRSLSKMISPAPTTPGMPEKSPGAIGNYMGWQIVKSYMNRHPSATIEDLLLMRDAQKLLDDAKYKPVI